MKAAAMKIPLVILAAFSIAFGVEEAIIVIYLRHLPAGYAPQAYGLEMSRELCTLLALGAIAFLSASTAALRLRAFCFAFGVWDIVYYIALWQLSGIPRLMDNDILFLIPVPWLAPVWSAMAFAFLLVLIGVYGTVRRRSAVLAFGFALGLLSFIYRAEFHASAYPVWLFAVSLALVVAAIPISSVAANLQFRAIALVQSHRRP
jgi:hypothetical protein